MDSFRAAMNVRNVLVLGVGHTTKGAPEAHADTGLRRIGRKGKSAIIEGELRRCHGKLGVPIQTFEPMRWEISAGLPIANFGCSIGIEI